MTTTPLPPAIEPVAWFEYARKKPTLKRLVFDRTSRSQLRVAGWVSEPLVKESDATQARADLEAENKRLRGLLEIPPEESERVMTVVYRNPTREEVQSFMDHQKAVWFGWCHAPHQRDAARAALKGSNHD